MAWTVPKRWVSLLSLDAADLNTQLRDNMIYLKSMRPIWNLNVRQTAGAKNNATWVPVPGGHSLVVTKYGSAAESDLLFRFETAVYSTGGSCAIGFNIFEAANVVSDFNAGYINPALKWQAYVGATKKVGVAAGAHTFEIYWSVPSGEAAVDGSNTYSLTVLENPLGAT